MCIRDRFWLSKNKLDANKVSLYRYSNQKWHQLETVLVSFDSDNYYYQATTQGFSYFAIGAEPLDTTKTIEQEKLVCPYECCSNEKMYYEKPCPEYHDCIKRECRLQSGLCGNNVINELEECDGDNLGNATCKTLGYASGTLRCKDCKFDISECSWIKKTSPLGQFFGSSNSILYIPDQLLFAVVLLVIIILGYIYYHGYKHTKKKIKKHKKHKSKRIKHRIKKHVKKAKKNMHRLYFEPKKEKK